MYALYGRLYVLEDGGVRTVMANVSIDVLDVASRCAMITINNYSAVGGGQLFFTAMVMLTW